MQHDMLQVFYIMDPVEAVQELFYQPEFAAARGTGRTYNKGSWYASQHYKDLNSATNGQMDRPENSAYDLGVDGVELMHTVNNSTIMAFMRCGQDVISCGSACQFKMSPTTSLRRWLQLGVVQWYKAFSTIISEFCWESQHC